MIALICDNPETGIKIGRLLVFQFESVVTSSGANVSNGGPKLHYSNTPSLQLNGVPESVIIFSFAMTGNVSSIGYILAAKAFARFKELDDKDFAEYVLIGTLLSASITNFVASLFQFALKSNT
ncbi:MAG: hypothetical protein ACE5D1_01065 [Fidelibacterota bacterium]